MHISSIVTPSSRLSNNSQVQLIGSFEPALYVFLWCQGATIEEVLMNAVAKPNFKLLDIIKIIKQARRIIGGCCAVLINSFYNVLGIPTIEMPGSALRTTTGCTPVAVIFKISVTNRSIRKCPVDKVVYINQLTDLYPVSTGNNIFHLVPGACGAVCCPTAIYSVDILFISTIIGGIVRGNRPFMEVIHTPINTIQV